MIWLWKKEKINKELIEYAEQEAKILAAFQIECADALERAGTTLLNILLSGAGGGLALAISLYGKNEAQWLIVGTFSTSFYLFCLCAFLTYKCLWSRGIRPLGNQPNNIYNDYYKNIDITKFKSLNLSTRQLTIEENRERNDQMGFWLNSVRVMASITPMIMIISYLSLGF